MQIGTLQHHQQTLDNTIWSDKCVKTLERCSKFQTITYTTTSAFTEYIFCESVDSAHNSQISSTFQEADCLLKLVKVNK